jgi:hypothetical protein
MEDTISIKEYFLDLFRSFDMDKKQIQEQLMKDYRRMTIIVNNRTITTLEEYCKILNSLNIWRVYKRMLWILPTQVSMVYFYFYLHNYYIKKKNSYIVAELGNSNKFSNDFILNINIVDNKYIDVSFKKNFRVLDTSMSSIPTIYNIFLTVDMNIGRSKIVYFNWKETV